MRQAFMVTNPQKSQDSQVWCHVHAPLVSFILLLKAYVRGLLKLS